MQIEVLEISEWETPASSYEEERINNFKIEKQLSSRGYRTYFGMDGYTLSHVKRPIWLTTLREFDGNWWKMWMIDSPCDYRAMQKYAEMAHGNVLTTGLGLGLLVHELCKNPEVTGITVVELKQSVIELVQKYLPQDARINIVCSDFWNFIIEDNTKWDTIIVDHWVFVGEDRQIEIYKDEVIPANEKLQARYPKAQIIFHAFAGLPSIEEVNRVAEEAGDTARLIYGLSNNTGGQHGN